MEYNFKAIGKRISEERKRIGIRSQSALTEVLRAECPVGRNTISALETGKEDAYRNVSLELLSCLCKLFGCDLGFLLGTYPEHTQEAKLVCEYTGLSEKAVNNIITIASWQNRESESFNMFLESDIFWDFVLALSSCYTQYERIDGLQRAQTFSISENPDTEEYRKQTNDIVMSELNKVGEESASFKLNRVSILLADYLLKKSNERWGNNGEKEHP